MSKQISPLPWADDGRGSLRDASGKQVDVWGLGVAYAQRSPNTEGNSAFIVKACNSHDKLVAALRDLRMAISFRAACIIEGNAAKISFANDKMWKAHEAAGEALAAAGEGHE